MNERYERQRKELGHRGQERVLRWWDELGPTEQDHFLNELEAIPWARLDPIMESHVLGSQNLEIPTDLEPATVYPAQPEIEMSAKYDQARELGRQLLREGKVAAFTVAGGQGTRLGFDGPKGALAVTPVGDRTLFQLFADSVAAAREKFAAPIPWYVMTSEANHAATHSFLEEHSYFGLPRGDVMLFSQGMLPAFSREGVMLLEEKGRLALAPDGHGGSLTALASSQSLADMRSRGVQVISYFQIDNPLVKPFDPLFIGLHSMTQSEMSTKIARKADDLEKVGNVCVSGGRVVVVEYSDFPSDLAHARDDFGNRKFDAGNLAMHLLNVDFVDRVVGESFSLPFRRAEKRVAYVNDAGERVDPSEPNAIKLETFVFDVLPQARNPLVLEVHRSEEFSPVKNKTGIDSLESSMRDQSMRAVSWLETAGVTVPKKADGTPDVTVSISPRFALDSDDLSRRIDQIPELKTGDALFLE